MDDKATCSGRVPDNSLDEFISHFTRVDFDEKNGIYSYKCLWNPESCSAVFTQQNICDARDAVVFHLKAHILAVPAVVHECYDEVETKEEIVEHTTIDFLADDLNVARSRSPASQTPGRLVIDADYFRSEEHGECSMDVKPTIDLLKPQSQLAGGRSINVIRSRPPVLNKIAKPKILVIRQKLAEKATTRTLAATNGAVSVSNSVHCAESNGDANPCRVQKGRRFTVTRNTIDVPDLYSFLQGASLPTSSRLCHEPLAEEAISDSPVIALNSAVPNTKEPEGEEARLEKKLALTCIMRLQKQRKKHGAKNVSRQCDLCSAKLSSYFRLLTHYQAVHAGVRPFVCAICQESFSAKHGLQFHMDAHLGVYSYCCDQCGKMFRQPRSYKVHLESHSEEKEMICADCGSTFSSVVYLRQHIRKYHKVLPKAKRRPLKDDVNELAKKLAQSSSESDTSASESEETISNGKVPFEIVSSTDFVGSKIVDSVDRDFNNFDDVDPKLRNRLNKAPTVLFPASYRPAHKMKQLPCKESVIVRSGDKLMRGEILPPSAAEKRLLASKRHQKQQQRQRALAKEKQQRLVQAVTNASFGQQKHVYFISNVATTSATATIASPKQSVSKAPMDAVRAKVLQKDMRLPEDKPVLATLKLPEGASAVSCLGLLTEVTITLPDGTRQTIEVPLMIDGITEID